MTDALLSIPKHWVGYSRPVSWKTRVLNMRRCWFVYHAEHFDLAPHEDCPKMERFELAWHLLPREVLKFRQDFMRYADRMPTHIVEEHRPPERRQMIQAQRLPGKRWFSLTVAAASPGAALRRAGASLMPHGCRLRMMPKSK